MLPHDLTILIDDREKRPLQFPGVHEFSSSDTRPSTSKIKVHTERARLPEGDYAIKGYEECGLVERKLDAKELYQNLCSKDSERFHKAIARLRDATRHPLIVVESTPYDLSHPPKIPGPRSPKIDPVVIRDRLLQVSLDYNIPVWFLPGKGAQHRRLVSSYVIAHLLGSIRHVLESQN